MKPLTERVFYHDLYPTVGCVVTEEGVLAVDGPAFPSAAAAWRDFIASKGPLRYHVNSEHHADHIIANAILGGAVIVSSEVTRENFLGSVGSDEGAAAFVGRVAPDDVALVAGYRLRWPEVTYRGRMTLHLGGETFRLFHAPGHTRGQTVVHAVEARVALTGDNLTPGMHPFFHSAAVTEWFDSLDLLASLDVDWFVPGHGAPCGRDELPRQRQKLEDVIGEVRRLAEAGCTREEVQERARYVDRPGLDFPRVLGDRAYELERNGLGNIFDAVSA